jgi:galactosylceramidase
VTLTAPDLSAFTLVLETLSGGRCSQPLPPASQTLTFAVSGGLPGPGTPLAVWRTNASAFFVRSPSDSVIAPDGSFIVEIAPNEMVTVTTLVHAGGHGVPSVPIPPSAPFPLPYSDDFSGYAYDSQARYFADQYGSYAVRNGSMQQVGQQLVRPGLYVNDNILYACKDCEDDNGLPASCGLGVLSQPRCQCLGR